jgi:DNA polymerase elongation subunit (family B)
VWKYKVLSALYLVDAIVTETNAIKLRFLDTSGKVEEFIDNDYKPYFLTAYPLTNEQKEVAHYFNGHVQFLEKTDLFTNQRRALAKISWPNAKIALKAAERFQKRWEGEIDFAKSYIYDKGLVFGALHSRDSLKPALDVPATMKERFEKTFSEVQLSDPLKYAQIFYWFSLLSQPVPEVSAKLFGAEEVDAENAYAAWTLSRIANLPLTETFDSHRVSDWLKSIIHTHLRRNDFLIPTAEELTKGKPTHRVTGALTVAPKAGTYFNTVVCDFESLYPSCIDSFNLSYETVNCSHPECSDYKIPDFDGHVCKQRRGFYAVLVGALKELRIKVFKRASKDNSLGEEERRKAAATAKLLKLILVSSYGVTVRIHGLACPPLAEAITGYGRYVLKESWRMAEEKGLRPLYGDTDSLFLDMATDEQIQWLVGAVKERFRLDLAVDKRYSLCVLPKAKKAYFGILLDGTPDIKGVTAVKSNAPRYVTNVFQQCIKELSHVKNQEEYMEAVMQVKKIVRKAIQDLKSRSVKLSDMTYSVRLYFDPNEKVADMKTATQPYQCALQLIDMGKKLKKGDTVSFIKVKPFNYKGRTFTVKPAELVTNAAELNVSDYVRNLLTALNQTFEPMGIKLETEKETDISRWLSS